MPYQCVHMNRIRTAAAPIRVCVMLHATSRGLSPVVSFTTEHAATGFAGRGRRWEVFASRSHLPFVRGAGDSPVLDPKGFLRTDILRLAKQVSVCSVVFQPTVFVSILHAISRGQSPVVSFPTEHAETGFAGRGRRWEVFASRSHRPFARGGAGDSPVSVPKGFLRTDFPRPAKRVSVCSVVQLSIVVFTSIRQGSKMRILENRKYFKECLTSRLRI